MKMYKGFDKDMKCRGYQFEVGKTYEEPEAKLCARGFHACEHPLDVFRYYAPGGSRFAEVDLGGLAKERDSDTKRAGKCITITAELKLHEIISAAVKFVFERADWSKKETQSTGDMGAASATGDMGAASATGYRGAASATGDMGAASATGDMGAASATGARGAASATGDMGAASAVGDEGCAIALGIKGKASGKLGTWLTLSEWREDDDGWHRINVKTHKVDGKTVKADTWYQLKGGKFVEVAA